MNKLSASHPRNHRPWGLFSGMSRRGFLQFGLQAGGLSVLGSSLGCGAEAGQAELPPAMPSHSAQVFPAWAHHARIANASFGEGPDPAELQMIIDALKAEQVSVIEVDTILSYWLTDAEFTAHMADIANFAQRVHQAGMKLVCYYPSLEVLSAGGELGPSFYKNGEGGLWVQRGIDGQPNVFYGSLVFWVAPGDESCWLSPNSPWRQYYLNRIRQLAATGIDGIWPDVPIYFDGLRQWCDTSTYARTAFKADSGLDIPSVADLKNPDFRRYVEWRHRNLNQFLIDIAAAASAVNPDVFTFVETVTMDYQDGTRIGLDGAYLKSQLGATHVWEVDVLSNRDAMRYATEDDWICLISMYKYGRAASGRNPAWAFSYGARPDDASLVMGQVLVTGCNPYEVKAPEKTQGVDSAMRTRMYSFIAAHEARIFDAQSLAEVAVYHSSASRDFVNPQSGNGLFANAITPSQSTEWWSSNDPQQSCYNQQWLGEFRGMIKALVHAHIPFDVLTSPRLTLADLSRYRVLIMPNIEAVSDEEAGLMREFVTRGGAVIATGPNPTGWNQLGDLRADLALADVFGLRKSEPLPASRDNTFGQGRSFFFAELLGGQYLRSSSAAVLASLVNAVLTVAPPKFTMTGDRRIHVEAKALGNETLLHLLNFSQFGSVPVPFAGLPQSVALSVAIPPEKMLSKVELASPDHSSPVPQAVAYTQNGGRLEFRINLAQYAIVIITWR
jgi:hypothetical protein